MANELAWPQNFFRLIHPVHAAGGIVLERTLDGKGKRSRVDAGAAEKIARMSCNVPAVYFSVNSFSGMPLLTNFVSTNALYVRVLLPKDARVSDWAKHAYLREIYNKIEAKGFPIPTLVTDDGDKFTLYWVLEHPLLKHEFHKVFLYQRGLHFLLGHLGLAEESLETSSLVPLVGTRHPVTRDIISLIATQGPRLKRSTADARLLDFVRTTEPERLSQHATAVLELLLLFHDRTLTFDNQISHEDWLIFFGASLSQFCTSRQLIEELHALAVSLEGRPWRNIRTDYHRLVSEIAASAIDGEMRCDGIRLYPNQPDWFELAHGKLNVTEDEIERLGLLLLSGRSHFVYPNSLQGISELSIGEDDFIPVERLLLNRVA